MTGLLASGPAGGSATPLDPRRGAEVRAMLVESQQRQLVEAERAATHLREAQTTYETVILEAVDMGCGWSAIGRAVGLSEAAIRGYVARRRRAA